MHEYRLARTLFGFAEFGGWATVISGVLIFIVGIGIGGNMGSSLGGSTFGVYVGAFPGLIVTIVGLIMVLFVQIGRATVDTAQMTGKLLQNSNKELKILKAKDRGGVESLQPRKQMQSWSPPTGREKSAAEQKDTMPAIGRVEPTISTDPNLNSLMHNGKSIRMAEDGAFVGMLHFEDVEGAKQFIDQKLIPSERLAER